MRDSGLGGPREPRSVSRVAKPNHMRALLPLLVFLAGLVGCTHAAETTAPGAPAEPAPAGPDAAATFLRPDEALEFRLGWGIFGNSGTTRIETTKVTVDGAARLKVHVVTKSRGFVDDLYPVANDSESLLDPADGRPLAIKVTGKAGKRDTKTETIFDYTKNEVRHTDTIRPGRSGTAVLPAEPAYDLMVAMLKTRAWNLKVGESRQVQISNEDEFFTIEVKAIEETKVKTPAGRFDAVVLEPKQLGELKGFFKKGGGLKIWVSKGDVPQVVRFDTKTKAGTISASLVKAGKVEAAETAETPTPPAAATAGTATAAPVSSAP